MRLWRASATAVVVAVIVPSGSIASDEPLPIAVAANRAPSLTGEIFRLELSGHLSNLTRSQGFERELQVSPDGRRIAFMFGSQVGVMDADGRRRVTLTGPHAGIRLESWSADGTKLLGLAESSAHDRLYVLQPRRRPRLVLERRGYSLGWPAWSPDATAIAVHTTVSDNDPGRLLLVELNRHRVTTLNAEGQYAWSARGRLAAVAHGEVRLYDGPRVVRSLPATAFSWSPDGSKLALASAGTLTVLGSAGMGRVLRRAALPRCGNALFWVDASHVSTAEPELICRLRQLDIRTGKTARLTYRGLFAATCDGCLSRDRSLVAELVPRGDQFAIRVSRRNGSQARTLASVPSCLPFEPDGRPSASISALQFAGRALIYQSDCPAVPSHIYLMDADGRRLRRVTDPRSSDHSPFWSPDGSHIAFLGASTPGTPSCTTCGDPISVMDADGGSPRVLTEPVIDEWAFRGWSADSKQILYGAEGDWAAVSLNGKHVSLRFLGDSPVWVPGGFVYEQDGGIYAVRADGSGRKEIAEVAGDMVFDITSAPDGRIAWTENSIDGPGRIVVARQDGTGKRTIRVQAEERLADFVGWSRAGALAWVESDSQGGTNRRLWTYSGGKTRQLPLPFAGYWTISWIPDGSGFLVAGSQHRNEYGDVYVLSPAGRARRLTRGLGATGAASR